MALHKATRMVPPEVQSIRNKRLTFTLPSMPLAAVENPAQGRSSARHKLEFAHDQAPDDGGYSRRNRLRALASGHRTGTPVDALHRR